MTAVRVQRWLFAAVLVLVLVLVATGVWLTLAYRPGAPAFVTEAHHHPSPVRAVHRWSALAVVPCAVALLVAGIRPRRWMLPAGLAVAAVVASLTGSLLAWDQLALWAVSVDDDVRGVLFAAFDDRVRFVLVDGAEIGQATYRRWFFAHAALSLLAAVLVAAIAARLAPPVPPAVAPTAPGDVPPSPPSGPRTGGVVPPPAPDPPRPA